MWSLAFPMLFQCHYEVASITETERELLPDSPTLRCQDLPCSMPYLPVTDSNLPFDTRHPVLSGDVTFVFYRPLFPPRTHRWQGLLHELQTVHYLLQQTDGFDDSSKQTFNRTSGPCVP